MDGSTLTFTADRLERERAAALDRENEMLRSIADRGATTSDVGRVALGLLVFQDLAVVVMVLLVPMLAAGGGSGAEIAWALAKAGGLIAVVLIVARRLMPAVLEQVARTCSPELFLLTVIAVCLGTAWVTSLAGVSLSLGAFLAGLVVSESRFSQHALGEELGHAGGREIGESEHQIGGSRPGVFGDPRTHDIGRADQR